MADRSLPKAPGGKTAKSPKSPKTPKTPKKSPQDKESQRLHRKEKAVQELVDTEVTYNTLLGLLIVHYVQPLQDYKLITNDQHNTLFPQLQIIKGLSDKFLEDLKKRRESWDPQKSKLSDLFETFTPYFRMYQGYVNNHEKSVALMRKLNEKEKWAEYCTNVRPLCQRFDLASLLILPIQRLPRYKLLLSEILKNTTEEHPDATELKKSLEKVQNISLQINSRMKEFERRETVKKIERKFDGNIKILEPHRQFIREGKLWKVCRNKDRLYQFFLFNDILIYASSYGRGYKFHNMLPINAAFNISMMEDASSYGAEKNGRIFSIVSEKKSFVVYADTTQEAKLWVDDVKECIEEQSKKAHSGHYKTDSHSAGVWVPDSHQKTCNICSDKFSFVNRRHHCRRCGALVCGKCSKYKLPNAESVMQRACKNCYFQFNLNDNTNNTTDNNISADTKELKQNEQDDDEEDEDDFEDENAALHGIPYYVDNADESFTTEDIFNKFGHGVGSYVLVPADQDTTKSEYYTVTLVVYTQTGFESFNVSLFEKKGAMLFRLESKKLKKKDFNDMNGLIAYIEKKEKLIFSYAIPRSEVEAIIAMNRNQSKWGDNNKDNMISPKAKSFFGVNGDIQQQQYQYQQQQQQHQQQQQNDIVYSTIGGLENYPKAKALFDYEAEVHGDLTLRAGDIIYILDREEEDGWWTGMIGNRQGLFPSTYVEIIEEKPLPSIHKNEPNEGDILVARYDYQEGGAEELAFNIGDKIILQAKDESGWWLGKLDKTGVVGWFAPDLVVPLEEQTNNITPMDNGNNDNNTFKFDEKTVTKNGGNSKNNKNNKNNKKNVTKDKDTKSTAPPKGTKGNKGSKGSGSSSKAKAPPKGSGSSTKTKSGKAPPKGSKKKVSPPKSKKKNTSKNTSKNTTKNNTSTATTNGNNDDSKVEMGDEPSIIISYEKLKVKDFGGIDVDKTKLEIYLSNKEFYENFKMSRSEFAAKPAWKQRNLKKDRGLF